MFVSISVCIVTAVLKRQYEQIRNVRILLLFTYAKMEYVEMRNYFKQEMF